jgi:hypothetical protein
MKISPFFFGAQVLGHRVTGCLMKNASTHNFVIYYPISMNKKIKDMFFQALQNSHKMFFFGVIFNS